MKTPVALVAAACTFASLVSAQHEAYGIYIPLRSRPLAAMPQFTNPFQRNTKIPSDRSSHGRKASLWNSVGKTVGPGKVISKAEREQRRSDRVDSAYASLDGQADEKPFNPHTEHNLAGFIGKAKADPWIWRLNEFIEDNFAEGSCVGALPDNRTSTHPYNLRSLLVSLVLLLCVFSALYNLLEYLLFASRASACSISTVYFPVTYTVTSAMTANSSGNLSIVAQPTTTHTLTAFHTETVTKVQTLTLSDNSASIAPAMLTSQSPSYVYIINSAGHTEWVNGVSPTSGAAIAVVTNTVTMRPVSPTSTSTVTSIATVTPPAFTSTIYSYGGPDLTSTSTSTHYITMSLSQVSQHSDITTTRSSFPGVSSGGWNSTDSSSPQMSVDAVTTNRRSSTVITVVSYFGKGHRTTSTYTTFITTTIRTAYTTNIPQVIESSLSDGYTTTLTTALPITIHPGTGGITFSTSVTTPKPVASTLESSTVSSIITTSSSSVPSLDTTKSTASATARISALSSNTYLNATTGTMPTASAANDTTSTGITSTLRTPFPLSSKLSSTRSFTATSVISTTPVPVTPAGISTTFGLNHTNSRTSNVVSASVSSSALSSPSVAISARLSSSIGNNSAQTTRSTTTTFSSSSTIVVDSSSSSAMVAASLPLESSSTHTSTTTPSALSTTAASLTVSSVLQDSFTSLPSETGRTPSITFTSTLSSTLATLRRSSTTLATTTSGSSSSASASPVSASSASISLASVNSASLSTSDAASSGRASASSPSSSSTATSMLTQTSNMPMTSAMTTATSTNSFPASSATSTPSAGCGEHDDFTANFDDLPRFLPANANNTDITQAPPIQSPYHHLTFSDGYVYAPEPSEPYQPTSQPHLAVFLANATGKTASTSSGSMKPGEIGDGPRDAISAFWFDAQSAYLGCDNPGPDPCTLKISGWTWDPSANTEIMTYGYNVEIPACKTLTSENCQLQKVEFPQSFRSLTGLQIQAFTGNQQRMFFMDDLAMAWSNNTCAAGLLRQSSQ